MPSFAFAVPTPGPGDVHLTLSNIKRVGFRAVGVKGPSRPVTAVELSIGSPRHFHGVQTSHTDYRRQQEALRQQQIMTRRHETANSSRTAHDNIEPVVYQRSARGEHICGSSAWQYEFGSGAPLRHDTAPPQTPRGWTRRDLLGRPRSQLGTPRAIVPGGGASPRAVSPRQDIRLAMYEDPHVHRADLAYHAAACLGRHSRRLHTSSGAGAGMDPSQYVTFGNPKEQHALPLQRHAVGWTPAVPSPNLAPPRPEPMGLLPLLPSPRVPGKR